LHLSDNRLVLTSSIIPITLAAVLFLGFLPSSLAMAQLQQQQTTTTTTTTTMPTTPPQPSLSITTIPPLTPEEQVQQIRLQNVIASTTRDLNETEKQIAGVVFTPRWSEPIWVNANSIAVLIAYCLPGEFADSGQEILGGFGLEVLESYAIDLPQGFMAWMAVVGNEDIQNRRFPAALGVICASDLNRADTRILSPQEQQQMNNINQQFSTIQNTQITNIDQVINIINNVTEPTTTEEGQQPLTVEVSANATEAYKPATIRFDSKVTGGTAPYSYTWRSADGGGQAIGYQRNLVAQFEQGSRDIIILNVTDSKGQTASDSVPITLKERPFTVEIIPNATQAVVPAYIKFDANITGGTEPYSYTWDYGHPDKPHGRSLNLVLVKAHLLNVILTVTDSRGKTATDTVQIPVEAPPPPTVHIISNATEGVAPATFSFEMNLNAGSQPYYWLWDFGDSEISQQQTVEHTFDQPGTYNVVLQVTDYGGSGSDNIVITVKEREPGVLLPPETGQEGQPLGGGLLPSTPSPPPPPNVNEVISPPEGGGEEPLPPPTEEGGEEPSPPPPPSDDTGGEGAGEPSPEEEPTTPPEGGG
jgi:PKD repeat protein